MRTLRCGAALALCLGCSGGGDGSGATGGDSADGSDAGGPNTGDDGSDTGGGGTDDGGTQGTGTTGSGSDDTGSPPCVGEREHAIDLPVTTVAPQDTDPAIRAGDPDHQVVEPSPDAVGKLFVFLPGTGGPPIGYRHVLRNAAAGGYHALGLAYVNDQAVNDLCSFGGPPECHGDVRLEILTGEDTSPLVDVGRADSVENRLVRLLEHLGWTQYLDGDAPKWIDIAFAGHSQGAGHAAMLARLHEVHRAVLFAGTEPGAWTLDPLATPLERLYGFVHTDDPIVTGATASWENLMIPGTLTSVDGGVPPFGDSHRLQTSAAPPDGNAHGAPVVDPSTPFDGDQPAYRDVWCVLIGP